MVYPRITGVKVIPRLSNSQGYGQCVQRVQYVLQCTVQSRPASGLSAASLALDEALLSSAAL